MEENHKQSFRMQLNEKLICNKHGHKRHVAHPKYPSKYCMRCGKYVDNWNNKKVLKFWFVARSITYCLSVASLFTFFGYFYNKHSEDQIQLIALTVSLVVVTVLFCNIIKRNNR